MNRWAVFCGAIILSASVLAQESDASNYDDYSNQPNTESLVAAPQEAVKAATETCRSWAKEDGIDEAELASYLLDCVNEDLQYQGYSPVTSID